MFVILGLIYWTKKRSLSSRWKSRSQQNSLAPRPHAGHQSGRTWWWDSVPVINQDLLQVSHTVVSVILPRTACRADPTGVQSG